MMGAISFGTMPVMLAQVFSDVGGYLYGAEFLSVIANLIAAFLSSFVNVFLSGFFGG